MKRAQERNTSDSGEEELSTPIEEEAEAQEPSVIIKRRRTEDVIAHLAWMNNSSKTDLIESSF